MRAPLLRPIRAHDDEAVGLQVRLVSQHAVLRSARPGCRGRLQERSGEDRVFEDGGDDGGKIPQHHDVPHDRNGQEFSPPKKSPPESAPKSAAGAPEFDAVAGVVEADDLLLGVNSLCATTAASSRRVFELRGVSGGLSSRQRRVPADRSLSAGHDGARIAAEAARRRAYLPAIVIPGNSDVSMAVEAMKAGATDFIEKPIGRDELIASLDRAFEFSRARTKCCSGGSGPRRISSD